MSEKEGLLSKREFAKRVAAVEKVISERTGTNDNCVPIAVAYTHGYSDDEFKMGLVPKAMLDAVDVASKELASKHGEEVVDKIFKVESADQVKRLIDELPKETRAAWFVYLGERGHIFGALKTDGNKFVTYKATPENPGKDVLNSSELAEIMVNNHTETSLKARIFGFKKK